MSEPKLISPMLDNFVMGDPMSDHNGVRCCPAMVKDSDKKYIVKIISIPASQTQLDALLLAGAYKDSASALEYFKELSNGVVKEAQVLQRLSKLEGFISYESWQVVPMENEVGYDIYLLSPYKRSLERFFRKHTMTHLGAVNLGLDLCAAMAICRHAGVLYVDLKPGNIFISEDQEYRIGDLGFIPLNSLKYASLPDKYRSAYTAPEIKDAYSALNSTIDIYAIGLILYQAFNGGVLPFNDQAPDEPLPAPQYADYEMAEIILKACAPNPEDRWQDPAQMGQALVSYMQRNGANDVPIVPPPADVEEPAPAAEETAPDSPETGEQTETLPDTPAEQPLQEDGSDASEEDQESSELQEGPQEEDAADLSFMAEMVSDETAPNDDTVSTVEYHELSDETSDILSQADELIAHEAPEPVVVPEHVDVPVPPPIVPEPETPAEDSPEEVSADTPEEEDDYCEEEDSEEEDDLIEDWDDATPSPHRKHFLKRFIEAVVVLLIIAGLLFGGYCFYYGYYLQSIDSLQLQGTEDQMSVLISTKIDESLLTVICKDTHGNVSSASVSNGMAVFTNLNPSTQYQVSLEVSGFHKLTGHTSGSYNTPAQTNVVQFDATTGAEDGSVILSFTVDGKEPDEWNVVYSAEGQEEQTVTFSGHIVTIRDLVVGKEYTFRLVSTSPLYIVGNYEITHTVSALIYAQNLSITSCEEESLTAVWEAPEGTQVGSWTVRCYNESGYDQTITTEETQAVFMDIDTTLGYTVEVIAEGMTVSTHTFISDNSVTISNVQTNVSNSNQIDISWDFTGTAPENGWLLLYTIDDSDGQEVIPCETNSATITPKIPGSHYELTLQTADGATVFNGSFSLDTPEASNFSGYRLTSEDIHLTMCLTPDVENWTYSDVPNEDITTTFQAGQKASFILKVYKSYNYDMSNIVTLFVIRDENGKLINSATDTRPWETMWNNTHCELDIPVLPDAPGDYTVTIYFNGAYVGEQDFTIVEAN